MWVVHWRGRTWPRGPSDGGAPRLKPGGNPQKSSILRGACGSFPGRGDGNFAAALDYNTKRRPWPGLEPVGQRDRPCGTPARRPKSRESTNFGNLKVAPQSKSTLLRHELRLQGVVEPARKVNVLASECTCIRNPTRSPAHTTTNACVVSTPRVFTK